MPDKIGFLQTASGEKSSTKLFNTLYGLVLIGVWSALCWQKQEIIPLDPTVIIPLGMGQGINAINKWIDANGDEKQAKFVKAIMTRVKVPQK
jgi:hypothetical protein